VQAARGDEESEPTRSRAPAPIHYADIGEIGERIRARRLSPVDLVNACLGRIARLQPRLNQALSPRNTLFANYYGLPAISVPCGFDSRGLPLGLQIVGRAWDDRSVLRLAHRYQAATGWSRRHPE